MALIKDCLETTFRYKWFLIGPLLVLTLGSILAVALVLRGYEAKSVIRAQAAGNLNVLIDTTTPRPPQIQERSDLLTALLKTQSFPGEVIKRTDLTQQIQSDRDLDNTITWLRGNLKVTVLGADMLQISVVTRNPQLSWQIVKATTDLFIEQSLDRDREEANAAIPFFQQQLAVYQRQRDEAQAKLLDYRRQNPELQPSRTSAAGLELAGMENDYELAEKLYEQAQSKLDDARLSTVVDLRRKESSFQVIDAPEVPRLESILARRNLGVILLAAVLGLGLGIAGVIIASLADKTIRHPLDLYRLANVRVLESFPWSADLARGGPRPPAGAPPPAQAGPTAAV